MTADSTPRCPTCDAQMSLEREFSRPIQRRQFPRGRWTCPFEHTDWHLHAERLEREIFATTSPTLKALLERDLKLLLDQPRVGVSATEAA